MRCAMKAIEAAKMYEKYWNASNDITVVFDDLDKLYVLIAKNASNGMDWIILNRDVLPSYFYCDEVERSELSEIQYLSMVRRRKLLIQQFEQNGYSVGIRAAISKYRSSEILLKW